MSTLLWSPRNKKEYRKKLLKIARAYLSIYKLMQD